MPGERLLIRDGIVYINGRKLDEPYLPEAWTTLNNRAVERGRRDGDPSRTNTSSWATTATSSQDSRIFGPISRDRIDGKAWFRIWPLDHFGNIYAQVPTLESATTFAVQAAAAQPLIACLNALSLAKGPMTAIWIGPLKDFAGHALDVLRGDRVDRCELLLEALDLPAAAAAGR